ncbi:MAG TPA: acetyl-CoA carboxylase biotin carboxyl carrier protein [Thermoanaerobaculia bacterium]|nr:acetyl-CoA carboxylase biotin carboxyl carrier protein [Thermoanaerobaculia bacterium]
MTFDQMKELIMLVAGHRLGGVEVRQADFHFRVEAPNDATPALANTAPPAADAAVVAAAAAPIPPVVPAAPAPPEPPPEPPGHMLTSPIVGTFYAAPSPDAEPYIRVGDRVQKGQVVCIIEAMKLMNEIESDVSGVVQKIYPENAQPVEFGEPLFSVKTD